MAKKITTTNLEKHKEKNPISRFFLNNFYTVLFAQIRKANPKSILDVGCGEGFTLKRLEKEKLGKRNEGIDSMDDAIKLAKKIHPELIIKKGDIYKLPYKANSFDMVVCNEVLEHLERPMDALAELRRVTRKYVVLSVPNEPLFTISRMLRGKNLSKFGDHPEHIQHWSEGKFAQFIGKNNLEIICMETPLPWTLIVAKKK